MHAHMHEPGPIEAIGPVETPHGGSPDPFFGQNDQKKGLAKMAHGPFWPFFDKIRGVFRIGEKDPPLGPQKVTFWGP